MLENAMENVLENTNDVNESPKQAERVFTQAELNRKMGERAHEAVEAYKRKMSQPEPQYTQPQQSFSAEEIRRLASEQMNLEREEFFREKSQREADEAADKVIETYHKKIALGKEKYDDFDAVTSKVNMGKYFLVAEIISDHIDNAPDVIYELSKNRSKLHLFQQMAKEDYDSAIYEMSRFSESIKANENTPYGRKAKAPLTQQRPSTTGMDSSKPLTIADFKRLPSHRC